MKSIKAGLLAQYFIGQVESMEKEKFFRAQPLHALHVLYG